MSLTTRLSTGMLLLALGFSALSARCASADVLFSSLPYGGNGLQVSGPAHFSGFQELAAQFTSSETATLDTVDIALVHSTGDNSPVTISLYTSVNNVPGVLLTSQTLAANTFGTTSILTTLNFGGSPALQAGTPYFLDAFTTGNTVDNWLNSEAGSPFSITLRRVSTGGFFFIASSPLAFQVNGTRVGPVPEPGNIALLAGMGAVGAGFLRRRKQDSKAA